MKKTFYLFLSLLAMVVFFSCGASSSKKEEKKEEKKMTTVKGSVVDGEIEGAKVTLVEITTDDTGKALNGEVTTGEDGSFSIEVEVPDGKTIEDYMVKATGGVDTSSGDEQGEVELTRPIEGTTDQMVTPITSMLTEEVKEAIKSGGKAKEKLKAAKTAIKTLLGLDSDDDVTKNPLDNDKVLRNAVLLNKIAKKVKKEDRKKAFAQLRTVLKKDIVKATFTGKSFADGAAEDTGNGVLNKLFADAELTVPEADKSTAKSTFIEEAKADKTTAGLKDSMKIPGFTEKQKAKKVALIREVGKKVIKAFMTRDAATYGPANSADKDDYAQGILRLVTYVGTIITRVPKDKATVTKLMNVTTGILKGFTFTELKTLGGVALQNADKSEKTATEKATLLAAAGGNADISTKIGAVIKAVMDDSKFTKEALTKIAKSNAEIFTTVSGFIQ